MSNHFDEHGHPRMVDVSAKAVTARLATAEAQIMMLPDTVAVIKSGTSKKGDVLAVARLAAIMATKSTSQLIPLCHAIPIDGVEVEFEVLSESTIACRVTVRTTARTGVEMEALTGASIAALTIYDMCKSIDRGMSVTSVRLLTKSGGVSGDFQRPD